MTIIYLLLFILGIAAVIGYLILMFNGDKIQQKRFERFRQEKLKEGWSEEVIDIVLLSNDFML